MSNDITRLSRLTSVEESAVQAFRELSPDDQQFVLLLMLARAEAADRQHDNVIQFSARIRRT